MYKLILFDFDGTIADTSEGILDSHCYTLKDFGCKIPTEEVLRKLIGGNLLNIYTKTFGFTEERAREAISMYRKRYADVGIHKASLYPNFKNLLIKLKENGVSIGVATLKYEKFAKQMLFEMNVDGYFDVVFGMDKNDSFDKAMLITKCIDKLSCEKEETLFIGDTMNDYVGAEKAGVDFLGVTYGFGFSENESNIKHQDLQFVDNPLDILRYL